jgi:hypothetical protein
MVFEAGLISLIRTLLIIAAVFFAVRLFLRYVVPFLLGRFIRKQQEKFYGQQSANHYQQDEEGKVRVKTKARGKKKNDDLGDYIDYEEIDESK